MLEGLQRDSPMAVITPLNDSDIREFLARYTVGELLAVTPSQNGIENTTYFLVTEGKAQNREWVLTLIEHAGTDQVDFTCRLLEHLGGCGLPVPVPQSARDGRLWRSLRGKPAWLIPKAAGRHPDPIGVDHCAAIGDFLGATHRAGERFTLRHRNTRGLDWLRRTAASLSLPEDQRDLLSEQIAVWQRLRDSTLPVGAIHADLFHDNTLFRNGQLTAVIDFLFCCTDWLLLDVAIAVNDWCDDGGGNIDESRAHALLAAYSGRRHFTVAERNHWPEMLALAATRFWVSRLQPSASDGGVAAAIPGKNPDQYLRILRQRLSERPRDVIPLPLAL